MAIYIQLLTLSPEGREKALEDPESILRAQGSISVSGVQVLGIYSVLGECDFVNIVEASDNTAMARFSMELGVRAGAHITTMPAIPIGRMEEAEGQGLAKLETEAAT